MRDKLANTCKEFKKMPYIRFPDLYLSIQCCGDHIKNLVHGTKILKKSHPKVFS